MFSELIIESRVLFSWVRSTLEYSSNESSMINIEQVDIEKKSWSGIDRNQQSFFWPFLKHSSHNWLLNPVFCSVSGHFVLCHFNRCNFNRCNFNRCNFDRSHFQPFTLSTVHALNRVPIQPSAISTARNFNGAQFQPPQIQPLQLSSNQLITVTNCN